MTSDENKWRDVSQILLESYALLTFLYDSELEYVIYRLSHKVLVMGSRVDTLEDNQNAVR